MKREKKAITHVLSIVSSGLNSAQEWPPLELTVSHKSYKSGDCGADEAKLRAYEVVVKWLHTRAQMCSCVRETSRDRDSS